MTHIIILRNWGRVKTAKNLNLLLSEVGARLSDVFGVDNILWVEGSTEEKCFPAIVENVCKCPLYGTEIIGVKNTGDFEGKYAKTYSKYMND